MFPHNNIHNIHKCSWTFPDVKKNQNDHMLVDKRQHSNIVNAQSFRAADSHTDHYLVGAKVRERLSVRK
jgi:hypothetical protein